MFAVGLGVAMRGGPRDKGGVRGGKGGQIGTRGRQEGMWGSWVVARGDAPECKGAVNVGFPPSPPTHRQLHKVQGRPSPLLNAVDAIGDGAEVFLPSRLLRRVEHRVIRAHNLAGGGGRRGRRGVQHCLRIH